MLRIEHTSEDVVTPPAVDDVHAESREPVPVQEGPRGSAARMLELAATTAEELVARAKADADQVVTTAQAEAHAIREAGRKEAYRAAAELDRERAAALTALAEEKAALESQIADLRSLHSDHRTKMRRHLSQQLELLDLAASEFPVAHVG